MTEARPPSTVLFDLDGTFADTLPDLSHALGRAMVEGFIERGDTVRNTTDGAFKLLQAEIGFSLLSLPLFLSFSFLPAFSVAYTSDASLSCASDGLD